MIHGASTATRTVIATRAASETDTRAETERHASSRSFVRSSCTSTGTKIDVRMPPSTSS